VIVTRRGAASLGDGDDLDLGEIRFPIGLLGEVDDAPCEDLLHLQVQLHLNVGLVKVSSQLAIFELDLVRVASPVVPDNHPFLADERL